MERIQSINPERIVWCCAERGITTDDLALELGIAKTSIERLMRGEDGVTFHQLRKIAEYFGRGVLFFLEEGPVDEAQVYTPQFRTLANQKTELSAKIKSLIERVEKQREVYLALREELNETDVVRFHPPDLPQNNPSEAARITRQWLALADNNSFRTYRTALEAVGILVFQSNGYNGKWQIAKDDPILGFSLYYSDSPVIFIKKQSWEPQQSFTLMHELGHLLLHRASSIDDEYDLQSYQGRERDANAFAGHLLVPDTFLASISDADRPDEVSQYDEWLAQPRKAWGVSGEVILRRLLDSGRLSQSHYTNYRQWKRQLVTPKTEERGSREYRHREPKHVFGDTFVQTVLDALNAQHITLAKASSYLDSLKIKDLQRLERHYAGL
jgi:Zn-dependent peptidase ImmA (M78 family)